MEFLGIGKGFKPEWSQQLIDTLVNVGKENGDFSCKHYPKSVPQLYEAMERVMALEKDKKLRVLVAGSISPWVEAVVLSRPGIQLERLVTTDYNPIQIHSDQIEFVTGPIRYLTLSFRTAALNMMESDGTGIPLIRGRLFGNKGIFPHAA